MKGLSPQRFYEKGIHGMESKDRNENVPKDNILYLVR